MVKLENALPIINKLMSENAKVNFNLFYLFLDNEGTTWYTDEKSYIIGQTDANRPMWIWMDENVTQEALAEVEQIIEGGLEENAKLNVTADERIIQPILYSIAKRKKTIVRGQVPMVIYRCDKVVNSKKAGGHMILSDDTHREIMERFITGMVWDLARRPMNEGEAENFAKDVAGSANFYLWEDEGQVVSMAMIAHRSETFARINTVYTDASRRGEGYAGMLVGTVTQKILDEGRIPILYTEQDNVCSNATYRRIGYTVCGELRQFQFGE